MFFHLIPLCYFFLLTQSTVNYYFLCWMEKLTSCLLVLAEWEKSTFYLSLLLKLVFQSLFIDSITLFSLIWFRLFFGFFRFLIFHFVFGFFGFWWVVDLDLLLRFLFNFILFVFFWRLRLLLNLWSLG